jgi:hypothetical protein
MAKRAKRREKTSSSVEDHSRIRMDPHKIERYEPDPHQSDKLDPDPHQSDKLKSDLDPHQFADDKPKRIEYEPI